MMDLLEIKARAMCYGIRIGNEETLNALKLKIGLDTGFIHGSILLIDGKYPVNTSILDSTYSNDHRALEIKSYDNSFYVTFGDINIEIDFLSTPPFHNQDYNGGTYGDYLQLHNDVTLFSTPVRRCSYIASDRPCLFCTYEDGPVQLLSSNNFSELLDKFLTWKPDIKAIAFGGGTPNGGDFGASYYSNLAMLAKEKHLSTSIELVPAKQEKDWLKFLESGNSDAIVSSLELWDDDVRSNILLGKSELNKDHYFKRWEQALNILGENTVSSVMLVGLEPIEKTKIACKNLIDAGVTPTLIPYRPYEASRLGALEPVNHEQYIELSIDIAEKLKKSNLNPANQPGCVECGACSLERTLTDTKYNNTSNSTVVKILNSSD